MSSKKMQAADQAIFRHVGIEPASRAILVLKSSVHFRADFEQVAQTILIVAANGRNPIDLTTLPYRRYDAGRESVGS